jgi:hypothetical protein
MKLGRKKTTPRNVQRRRGTAMLMVVMMSAFTMGIWMVTFRSTRDAVETESFHVEAPYYEGRIMKALAFAGNMLERDKIEGSRFRFVYAGQDDRGRFFTAVQLRKRSNGKYEASAHVATNREMRSWPRNPASFD